MKTFILSAMGKDRPGIYADVSEVIYECGGNVEESSDEYSSNAFRPSPSFLYRKG